MNARNAPTSPRRERVLGLAIGMVLAASGGLAGAAVPLELVDQPIYVAPGVAPNVVMSIDDSESLRWPDTQTDDPRCGEFIMWPGANGLAYDPAITYELPPNADGSARAVPSFTAAPNDGFNPDAPQFYSLMPAYVDLSKEFLATDQSRYCSDIPRQAAFYMVGTDAASVTKQVVTAGERRNFAIWFSFYRTRLLALKSATALAMVGARPDRFRFAWQGFNHDRTGALAYSEDPDLIGETRYFDYAYRRKFLDWLYHTLKPGGDTPTVSATIRAGEYFSKPVGEGPNVVIGNETGEEAQCRANYHIVVTDGLWEGSPHGSLYNFDYQAVDLPASDLADPPPGLDRYDPASADTKLYANFAPSTLADWMFKYWSRDLLPDVENRVPPVMTDPSTSPTAAVWNPANDPASWQHMVNHIVTLALPNVTPSPASADDLLKFRTGALTWPIHLFVDGARMLDTWHAALNSRGTMLVAQRPTEVTTYLRELLDKVEASSAQTAPVSLATGSVGSDEGIAYQVSMQSVGWSGDLVAYRTTRDGLLSTPLWSAACKLTGGDCPEVPGSGGGNATPTADARVILTSNAAGDGGVPFRWMNLSDAQRTLLDESPVTGAPDGAGDDRLQWVRGDREQERAQGGALRDRARLMGAVIDSQPVVVSKPYPGLPDDWPGTAAEDAAPYRDFVTDHASRPTMIYVGADDGMLHAFDTEGVERFAYVPQAAYATLPDLADPAFSGAAFVRGTPMVADTFYGGSWHTTLVAPLGRGGTGLFALDVTDPAGVTESEPNVLWDLSRAHDAMGHIYASPSIVRLADGNWWAVSGNGYNSPSGIAQLLVIRLSDGYVRAIPVGSVPDPTGANRANGLAGAVLSDLDRDGIAEFAIAGDLFGNLWRFDLGGASPSSWSVAGDGATTRPVFVAKGPDGTAQPITSTPRLLRGRASNRLVAVFGTGSVLEAGDLRVGETPTQSIYGVFDVAVAIGVARDDLEPRTLADGSDVGGRDVRVITGDSAAQADGWVIDLAADERVNTAATPRGSVVFVQTLLPGASDPCTSSFSSWLMMLDAETGLAPTALDSSGNGHPMPVLDLSGDGQLTSADLGGNTGGIAGVAFATPILGFTLGAAKPEKPDVQPQCDKMIVAHASGNTALASTCFAPRRTSWRQALQ